MFYNRKKVHILVPVPTNITGSDFYKYFSMRNNKLVIVLIRHNIRFFIISLSHKDNN